MQQETDDSKLQKTAPAITVRCSVENPSLRFSTDYCLIILFSNLNAPNCKNRQAEAENRKVPETDSRKQETDDSKLQYTALAITVRWSVENPSLRFSTVYYLIIPFSNLNAPNCKNRQAEAENRIVPETDSEKLETENKCRKLHLSSRYVVYIRAILS